MMSHFSFFLLRCFCHFFLHQVTLYGECLLDGRARNKFLNYFSFSLIEILRAYYDCASMISSATYRICRATRCFVYVWRKVMSKHWMNEKNWVRVVSELKKQLSAQFQKWFKDEISHKPHCTTITVFKGTHQLPINQNKNERGKKERQQQHVM